jgi:PKD repeat protein
MGLARPLSVLVPGPQLAAGPFDLSVTVAPTRVCDYATITCPAHAGVARVTLQATAQVNGSGMEFPKVEVVFVLESTAYDGGADPGTSDLHACTGSSTTSLCNESDAVPNFLRYARTIVSGIQSAHPTTNVSFAMLDGFSTHDVFDDGDGSVVWGDVTHFTSDPATFATGVNTSIAAGYPWTPSLTVGESDLTDNFLHGAGITQIYGALAGRMVNWTNASHRVVVWIGSTAPRDPSYPENYSGTYSVNAGFNCVGGRPCLAPTCEPTYNFTPGSAPRCESWVQSQDGQPSDSIASLATSGVDCRQTPGLQCTIDIVNPRTVPTDPSLTGWRVPNGTVAQTDASNILRAGCDLSAATGGSWDGPRGYRCSDGRSGTLPVHSVGTVGVDTSLIGALKNISLGHPADAGFSPPANGSQFQFVPGPSVGFAPSLNATTNCRLGGLVPYPCPAPRMATTAAGPVLVWNFSLSGGSTLHTGDVWNASFDLEVTGLVNGNVTLDRCGVSACLASGSGPVMGLLTAVRYIDPLTGNWTQESFDAAAVYAMPPATLQADLAAKLLAPFAPAPVQLNATAQGGVPPYNFSWSLGDGSPTSFGTPVDHTFVAPGSYLVRLNVNDSVGERQVAKRYVVIAAHPGPLTVALLIPTPNLTVGTWTTLNATVVGGFPSPAFLWSGLPRGCAGPNASLLRCRPTAPGLYSITVVVRDASGASATASSPLTVNLAPVVGLTWSGGLAACSGSESSTVTLVANGTRGTGPLTYAWSFGDGTMSAANATVRHTYATLGSFRASVTVTDASGANASASTSVTTTAPPCAPPVTPSGGSTDIYWIAGGIVVVAAVVVVALLVRRRRSVPSTQDESG